ncbi:NUDIX domain-containing protein [Paenibacillus sp. LjRoot153]|uniref:NUDIX domain-containing protein n=1 Tax=Paenibacillus sp. LjRoot153 TaxID=3342270 RepID=UPI003ECFB827
MNFNDRIVTAGVYVNVHGLFPFQVGPTKSGSTLGVIRLGGHREHDESGWECAEREAFEEAMIRIKPITPPATYWLDATADSELKLGVWQEGDVKPILVGKRQESNQITPIYLAYSNDNPTPANEAKALLLLSPPDIEKIVTSTITLGQYLESGGKAVFKESLPLNLVLEPFPHLRLLKMLLEKHPEIRLTSKKL